MVKFSQRGRKKSECPEKHAHKVPGRDSNSKAFSFHCSGEKDPSNVITALQGASVPAMSTEETINNSTYATTCWDWFNQDILKGRIISNSTFMIAKSGYDKKCLKVDKR